MRVKFFATYREVTGCRIIEIEAPHDVHELLEELSGRWPGLRDKLIASDGGIGKDAIILVNGRSVVHLNQEHTLLSDEDTVAVFPLVAGG